MNEFLRDRILRKLDGLSDERLYQVLDYVEFIESKYAERQSSQPNVFQKFAEGVEDKLRAGRVSASTIAETMNLMNRAIGVLNGVAAAGKSVANDLVGTASRAGGTSSTASSAAPSPPPTSTSSGATSPPPAGASAGSPQSSGDKTT
jgi:hypothetical protein